MAREENYTVLAVQLAEMRPQIKILIRLDRRAYMQVMGCHCCSQWTPMERGNTKKKENIEEEKRTRIKEKNMKKG